MEVQAPFAVVPVGAWVGLCGVGTPCVVRRHRPGPQAPSPSVVPLDLIPSALHRRLQIKKANSSGRTPIPNARNNKLGLLADKRLLVQHILALVQKTM